MLPTCFPHSPPRSPTHTYKMIDISKCSAQDLCESGGGRPGLPVPNSPYGLCGRKATLIIMEICEAATPRLKALNKHNTYNVH